jgi:ferredoxin-type protein NapH
MSAFQKVRKIILFIVMLALPIVFTWMSPVVIVIAGFQHTVNMGMIIFSAWFISSLFFGRLYCSFICMGGAGQEILDHLIKKPFKFKSTKNFKIIRYVIFTLWLGAILYTPLTSGGFSAVNPFFPNDPSGSVPFIGIPRELTAGFFMYFGVQLIFFLMLPLIFGRRASCHIICPMSVLGDIGARLGRLLHIPGLKLQADPVKCTQCKACNRNCQMGIDVCKQVKDGAINDPNCILCGECIDACPKKAVRFRLGSAPRADSSPAQDLISHQ